MTPEQQTKYIKWGGIALALGVVGYVLYKKGMFSKIQQKLSERKMPRLLKVLGSTFRIADYKEAKYIEVYGLQYVADTIKIGDINYTILFNAYVNKKTTSEHLIIEQPFRIMTVKPGTTKPDKIVFWGTWKIIGKNKLQMKFVTRAESTLLGKVFWSKMNAKLPTAKQYSGTITEILEKASGKSVKLDALKK